MCCARKSRMKYLANAFPYFSCLPAGKTVVMVSGTPQRRKKKGNIICKCHLTQICNYHTEMEQVALYLLITFK